MIVFLLLCILAFMMVGPVGVAGVAGVYGFLYLCAALLDAHTTRMISK